jgi:hypothetical protein
MRSKRYWSTAVVHALREVGLELGRGHRDAVDEQHQVDASFGLFGECGTWRTTRRRLAA